MKKYSLKEYFTFSKKDRVALIILFCIVAAFATFSFIYKGGQKINPNDIDSNLRVNDAIAGRDVVLFEFDPNTLDEEGWLQLGLSPKTAKMIINYRNKGGSFRTPESLRKIYSLSTADAERLIPYVRIVSPQKYKTVYQKSTAYTNHYPVYERKSFDKVKPFDINEATVEIWKTLPGIGDVLANRIVNYREKESGFASIEEVGKVYGLKDSVFQSIKPYLRLDMPAAALIASMKNTKKEAPPKLSINTAYEKKMAAIPAIGTDIAKAIVIYRQQHGAYTSLEDLKKIVFINQGTYERIVPYLTL